MDKEKTVSKSDVLELFRQMYLIRQFEIACSQHYTLGNIRAFYTSSSARRPPE